MNVEVRKNLAYLSRSKPENRRAFDRRIAQGAFQKRRLGASETVAEQLPRAMKNTAVGTLALASYAGGNATTTFNENPLIT
jgi:hypothetical protein